MAQHRIELNPSEVTRRRLERTLTRAELAKAAGISIHRLHKIEAGLAGGVSIATLKALALVLRCDPTDISDVVEAAS